MNTLESYSGDILGKEDVCAKFIIDDIDSPFLLSGIAKVGERYTLSFWAMSEASGSMTIGGKTYPTSTEWVKHESTFTADVIDLPIAFNTVGTYYIYQPQLEVGTMVTDWRPAPEDFSSVDDIKDTNERVQEIYESVSELTVKADGIQASVSSMASTMDGFTSEMEATKADIASMKLAADSMTVEIQKITNDGVEKVVTTTGTFDDEGLTVDKSDSPTKTQVTPDGMIVYKKDADGDQEEVLEATSEGVDATNLHAKTYLIIGGRSRFENYGTDRTGCFWIGG